MPITGAEIVAKNILLYRTRFLEHVDKAMEEVRKILDDKVTENISLEDHTQEDLDALDHPYARRHGSMGMPIHDPYWLVHKQSGKLLAAKRSGTIKASVNSGRLIATAYAGLDENQAPHALFVILGTTHMIPRPVLQGSKDEVIDKAIGLIKNNLRNMTFNFRGEQ